jgi:ADP-ribosylglycohydrolase
MGAGKSTGPMPANLIRQFFDPTNNFEIGRRGIRLEDGHTPGCDALAAYCILGDALPARMAASSALIKQLRSAALKGSFDSSLKVQDRSLGCVLGNIIGDALGAPLEFSPVRYDVDELKGLDHDAIWQKQGYNSFGLEPGQFTDDGSMALCIMDSLLCCNGFDPYDLRQRFHAWTAHGYNNAFGRSANPRSSVGLGGNISMSMGEWTSNGTAETSAGDQYTSGNGSVMRNGAIPVWFRNDVEAGMNAAKAQSRTTHAGFEAAELCRLLTFICIGFINGSGRELLEDMSSFSSTSYSVTCLATSKCEEAHEQNENPIFGGLDRRQWNWKNPNYRYCTFRAQDNPGYCGSYAMDAVAMALHCVYSTNSYVEATLKAANLCGDADSVCAVAGQIAGALYGVSAIPETWLARLQRWDGGTIAARALMLHNGESLGSGVTLGDAACASAKCLGQTWPSPEHL